MKWILVPVAVLIALLVLMATIGMTLPAAHTASRRARFRQPPQAVFAAISGPSDWRSDVSKSAPLADANGRQRWQEFDRRAGSITYELVESTPPLRRVTRIADENLPYTGTWNWEIAPIQGGSTLRVTERGEVKNVVFRFLSRFVFGETGSMDTYLADLSKHFNQPLEMEK